MKIEFWSNLAKRDFFIEVLSFGYDTSFGEKELWLQIFNFVIQISWAKK